MKKTNPLADFRVKGVLNLNVFWSGKVTITPKIAAKLLEVYNVKNFRKPSRARVNQYGREMLDGKWVCNGQPIVVASNGELNGQHRLLACVDKGVPFASILTIGVAPDNGTSDTGLKRSDAQWARGHGVPSPSKVIACVRGYLLYKEGSWGSGTGANSPQTFTPTDVREYLMDNLEGLKMLVPMVNSCKHLVGHAVLAPILLAGSSEDPQKHKEFLSGFCEGLSNGEGLRKGDPIFEMRDKLTRLKRSSPKDTRGRQRRIVIAAWNAAVRGEQISSKRLGSAKNGTGDFAGKRMQITPLQE